MEEEKEDKDKERSREEESGERVGGEGARRGDALNGATVHGGGGGQPQAEVAGATREA